MSIRQIKNKPPSFSEVTSLKERDKLVHEIQKIKPKVEVSIEGLSEIAKGQLIEWHPLRKFFTVKWSKRSEQFDQVTSGKTTLRAFFKCQLFTTQLVFKTTTVRRLVDGNYHYRIPEQLYKQQSRGALRVPIYSGAVLQSAEGRFRIVNLSTSGARLKLPKNLSLQKLTQCELILGNKRIRSVFFAAWVTSENEDQVGVRFTGTNEAMTSQIREFLIEALKTHYEKEW